MSSWIDEFPCIVGKMFYQERLNCILMRISEIHKIHFHLQGYYTGSWVSGFNGEI